jgi:hypothetical protein
MGHGGEAGLYLACAEHVLIKLTRQWRPWREQRDGSLVEHGAAKGRCVCAPMPVACVRLRDPLREDLVREAMEGDHEGARTQGGELMRGRVQEDNTCRIDWGRRSLDPIRQREPEASSTQISTNKVLETRVDGPPQIQEVPDASHQQYQSVSGHSFSRRWRRALMDVPPHARAHLRLRVDSDSGKDRRRGRAGDVERRYRYTVPATATARPSLGALRTRRHAHSAPFA